MATITNRPAIAVLAALFAAAATAGLHAQQPEPPTANTEAPAESPQTTQPVTQTITGQRFQPGAEIKGIISARTGNRLQVTGDDGTKTIVTIDDTTRLKGRSGLFGRSGKPTAAALVNGLPVTVKTMQTGIGTDDNAGSGLVASEIIFRTTDLKFAAMIRNGTAQGFAEQSAAMTQGFAEQTAATAALKGRMGDIDQYNIKNSVNVYFETGKWVLTEQAKADLCTAAATAEQTPNALLLVVGYTDDVGDEDFNQKLSEQRAGKVMNHLQQVCHWKPFRMLTPTGMAKADPVADNSTPAGKAQNRRVAVNVLVSKAVDAL